MAFLNTYILPYIKYTKVVEKDSDFDDLTTIYFSDGAIVMVHNGDCLDFHYDINGRSNPNTDGRDIFRFYLCAGDHKNIYFENKNQYFGAGCLNIQARND